MSEKLVRKNLEFSTADAEIPELFFFNGTTLQLKFTDWQGTFFRVEFPEVVAFSWNQEEIVHQEMRDDCVYEVEDSNWLKNTKNSERFGILKTINIINSALIQPEFWM